MSLTEFLLARIAEDEEVAHASNELPEHVFGSSAAVAANLVTAVGTKGQAHIRSWQPARVLAECEAKRRIIELADEASSLDMSVDLDRRVGPRDMIEEPYVGDAILAALALPYADHPDYPGEQQK